MGELYEYFTGNVKFCNGPTEMELAQHSVIYRIYDHMENRL